MDSAPSPFDSDAPLGARRAIIRRNPENVDEIEMVEATWGSDPRFGAGASFRFVRSEGQAFPNHRCLIPASEFHMVAGGKRFRVRLGGGEHFYLAGIWEPALGDWPLSYRVITVAANAEVVVYQDRHGAIIDRWQVMQWLDHEVAGIDILETPPARTFVVQEIGGRQTSLAL